MSDIFKKIDEFEEICDKFTDCGATDSEPRYNFRWFMRRWLDEGVNPWEITFFDNTASKSVKFPNFTSNCWDLYTVVTEENDPIPEKSKVAAVEMNKKLVEIVNTAIDPREIEDILNYTDW